ncbi:MAG: hypothetical protein AB8B88_11205 [Devosiaceae bacterium]
MRLAQVRNAPRPDKTRLRSLADNSGNPIGFQGFFQGKGQVLVARYFCKNDLRWGNAKA